MHEIVLKDKLYLSKNIYKMKQMQKKIRFLHDFKSDFTRNDHSNLKQDSEQRD